MDIINLIISIINTIFAALGVFVGVETLIAREKENRDNTDFKENIVIDEKYKDDFQNFKKSFGKDFSERKLGNKIIQYIYNFNKKSQYKNMTYLFKNNSIIRNYKTHYWIKFPFFINNIYDDNNMKYIFIFVMKLMIPAIFFNLCMLFGLNLSQTIIILFFSALIVMLPFGIYRDSVSGDAKVIHKFFNLGKVEKVSVFIKEIDYNLYQAYTFIGINFYFFKIEIPLLHYDSLKNIIDHYMIIRAFCEPIDKKLNIRYIEEHKITFQAITFFKDFYYGWLRLVWIITEKIKHITKTWKE